MTALTLNKITAQRGISVGEAAKKIADLGWNPSYVQEANTYPTDYKIAKAPRDPMKQVLRSYFPMQEEKDNRVYGALDAALRGDMFRNVEPRWVEWMKLFLAIIPFPEISAARSMAMVARLAPGEDLRTGFTMQMVDEFRHSTIQMNLKKWYMENYIDPAGFDITEEAFGKCYATTIGRQFGEGFITGDAMTAANMYLTVVAETAFTNTLFVAMPSEAARNGDYALPTVFLSVQSDESRHIGNGHSLLMATLEGPGQPPAARARHALCVLAEPRDRRRRHRHVHRVRHHQPRQGQGVLRGDVAPLDLRGLLPDLHAAAREVRHQDPPRRRPGGLGPHHQEELRPQGRAVLRGRLAGELLAHRGPDRQGLRVVRGQVPGLVRRVRRLLEVVRQAQPQGPDGHHLQQRRRLRLPAPLLVAAWCRA